MKPICRRKFLKVSALGLVSMSVLDKALPSQTVPAEEKKEYIAHCGYTGCPQCPQSCNGCLSRSDGKIALTVQSCRVRSCAVEKGVANCGFCPDYACSRIKNLYAKWKKRGSREQARAAKELLDKIHKAVFG